MLYRRCYKLISPKNMQLNINYLLEYKQSKGLTNKELAEQIGVHESTISRILNGKKGIGYKFIAGAFRLKDLDFNKLFSDSEKIG